MNMRRSNAKNALSSITCRREFMDLREPTKKTALQRAEAYVRQHLGRQSLREACDAITFNNETCRLNLDIPLRHTIPKGRKQFVLGRVDTLVANGYAHAGPCLQVLNLNYVGGPANLVWDIFVNDLFITCATQNSYTFGQFPIRLVIDPLAAPAYKAHGNTVRRTNVVNQRRLTHTLTTARNKHGLTDYALADAHGTHPAVTVREVCQLLRIFGMSLYRYVGPDWDGPYHLYFFSHASRVPKHLRTQYVKI